MFVEFILWAWLNEDWAEIGVGLQVLTFIWVGLVWAYWVKVFGLGWSGFICKSVWLVVFVFGLEMVGHMNFNESGLQLFKKHFGPSNAGHPAQLSSLMTRVCQRLSNNQAGFVVSLVFVFGEFGLKTVRLLRLCMRIWNNIWVLWIFCILVVWYNGYLGSMNVIWVQHD